MSDEDLCSVDCCECGIQFKFSKKIEEMWRKSGKTFHCPNGHNLCWTPSKESKEDKEIKQLRAEVKELKEKLATSEKKMAEYKTKAEELANELEIWRPSTDDKKAG